VAWMGGTVSSADEWIELYNPDASAVDLTGWHILADDGSPSIALSGSVASGGYFLIERTDDDSVVGIAADLVTPFGNGLENTEGETLRLKNASDVDVDVVAGGVDWVNVGGDNTSKQTAQRTANSWVTGVPTPRAQNVAQGGEVLGTTDTESATTTTAPAVTSAPSGGVSKPSLYPRSNIFVEVGSDMRGFAGFPISFSGSSTGLYNEPIAGATYRWNFGDGATDEGQSVIHVYDFAGEYVVTLEVFWSKYHERDRLSVVVIAPEVSIAEVVSGVDGFVRLSNSSSREIDISGWVLRNSLSMSFVFPPNSVILAKKSFTLSNKLSGLVGVASSLTLQFPDGRESGAWGEVKTPPSHATQTPREGVVAGAHDLRPAPKSSSVAPTAQLPLASTSSSVAATVLWEKTGDTTLSAGVFSGHGMLAERWMFGIFGSILVLIAGYMIARSRGGEPTVEDEYAIIEDIIEGKETLL
jgi:hypothetical protein